ncbi:tRNA (adenosine(37)-N6)-threonylcarbamoyltransferase complex ATPase subunit type 1 TsaE [Arthrobacter sp. Leaf69]|uniref:tRNA (adenosine(37)-N6)-threonylcarbamoyltransferase complex ATPase subunit type 1 TsaE n=1 Tax=Arthrobacter sp. Leaf69 TaxID=1736232 RepID=UPI0006F4A2A3|nr:tRNA (adenosine(37)-N6)-threonylcarbamoyltransferase complex ATPase subunit type 1 TsaE [Arthrobacter sp. Leaf69]KQN95051.1 tRNA threonylcarbamoyladenosine biosynthesis protein TsaE [Arthrobacter sp. Leaf69]
MSRAAWERTLDVRTADETHALAAGLGAQLQAGDLLVLTGELGAGKTTFTQGLGEGLGVRAGIISPTFVLVRIHPNLPDGPRPGGPDLVHVDAYRLGSASEIDDIDLENTMDSAVTVVEWGRGRVEHLSESRLEVDLLRSLGGSTRAPEAAAPEAARPENSQDTSAAPFPAVLDFDTDDDDEPRRIVIRGFGPRWVDPPVLSSPASFAAPAGSAETATPPHSLEGN